MSAPTLLAGTATYTRRDAHTRHLLDGFRQRLAKATDMALVAAAYRAETLTGHGMADEVRQIVDHEIEWRRATRPEFSGWWIATIRGGTR